MQCLKNGESAGKNGKVRKQQVKRQGLNWTRNKAVNHSLVENKRPLPAWSSAHALHASKPGPVARSGGPGNGKHLKTRWVLSGAHDGFLCILVDVYDVFGP